MKDYEDVILQEIADHLSTLPKTQNTFTIQLASVDAFADAIDYERLAHSTSFVFKYPAKTGEEFVSYQTMVKLHNALWVYDEEDKVLYPHTVKIIRDNGIYKYKDVADEPFTKVFKLAPYEYRKADSRRIVERVKIQADKHNVLHCQSNEVEFVCEWYFDQFIGEES